MNDGLGAAQKYIGGGDLSELELREGFRPQSLENSTIIVLRYCEYASRVISEYTCLPRPRSPFSVRWLSKDSNNLRLRISVSTPPTTQTDEEERVGAQWNTDFDLALQYCTNQRHLNMQKQQHLIMK